MESHLHNAAIFHLEIEILVKFDHSDHCASNPAAVWPVPLVTGSATDHGKWPNIISVDLGVRRFVGLFVYPPKPVAIGATVVHASISRIGSGPMGLIRLGHHSTKLVQLISLRFSTASLARYTVIADYATFCWTSPIEEIAKWVNHKDQCRTALGKITRINF